MCYYENIETSIITHASNKVKLISNRKKRFDPIHRRFKCLLKSKEIVD